MKNKTVLVTGSNTGIGRVTAEEPARQGAHVWLGCRSKDKTLPVIDAITSAGGTATFLELDLADLESVKAAAKTFREKNETLDVLVNNAGLAGLRGTTKQGFEITFGTNHLGHFLLTKLLMPVIHAGDARIVNVSSASHYRAKKIDWDAVQKKTASVSGIPEYEVSKLANVLFTKELARGRAGNGITSVSLHPGVVASDAWRSMPWPVRPIIKLFMITNEEGAKTTLHCVTTPAADLENGAYYDKCKPKHPSKSSQDESLAAELWSRSEEWVAAFA